MELRTPGQLLTVSEAAQVAGVHRDTIVRWIREQGLRKLQPAGRHGAVRIDAADFRAFLEGDRERP
jgi:excisionase family DNA binding protein